MLKRKGIKEWMKELLLLIAEHENHILEKNPRENQMTHRSSKHGSISLS